MLSTPLVSIIVPCYNIEKYIENCVQSILKQTFSNFELLLIDDGSSDDTLKVLNNLQKNDKRIKILNHKNRGVSYSRNIGIQQSIADYIIFIDGDDFIEFDFIESHIKEIKNQEWVVSGMINVKQSKKEKNKNFIKLLKSTSDFIIEKKNFFKLIEYNSLATPCCRVYSSEIIKKNKIQFLENISYQEDLLFNLEYMKHIHNIRLIDYFGYHYIEHDNGSSSRYHFNFEQIILLFEQMISMSNSKEDTLVLQEFFFQTIMKKFSNIMHPKSPKSNSEKLIEINLVTKSNYYNFILPYLMKTKINLILKLILKYKLSFFLFFYYRIQRLLFR